MTGVGLAIVIALTAVAGLLLWHAVVRVQTRITPTGRHRGPRAESRQDWLEVDE